MTRDQPPTDAPGWFDGFDDHPVDVGGTTIFARVGGRPDGPALLLLHGFPQSHVMWHRTAQRLRDRFRLVLPDLRGYGRSDQPAGGGDHGDYSKRTMARDVVAVMDDLGHDHFFVAGHDRGGRVAHRLAVDHPARVDRMCVLDIAPTLDMYDATDKGFATAYYHWFHLIQPEPLPELMIGGNPVPYLHASLGGLGSRGLAHIEPEALAEYERCFTPDMIHGCCEDYRASAGIDLEHDRESRERGDRIACDLLVWWGKYGVIEKLFDPLALWQAQCAGTVTGEVVPSGHFIPEALPAETARALTDFFLGEGSP